ncbi:MAG: DUF4886 domain-containing protein [Endomicrobiales bacterium]
MNNFVRSIVMMALFCGYGNAQSSQNALKVLFIGNSYTSANDLPNVFSALARSGGHTVEVDAVAPGGMTLRGHVSNSATISMINLRKWDFVVLQEQSVVPTIDASRDRGMYPAIRHFDGLLRGRGSKCVLFMTWGRRDGLAAARSKDYGEMQDKLEQSYMTIADELHMRVVPVGAAWRLAHASGKNLVLWQGDGSHPTVQGTYLAACVFYSTLFRESPENLSFTNNLTKDTARQLQCAAGRTVLNDPDHWHIPQ